ncbi:MAG: hypothetical protein MUO42_10395, partial [Anaerolineaceae bacterium]|nr:hypothetical protein [Anaerolineaceae bacterium]
PVCLKKTGNRLVFDQFGCFERLHITSPLVALYIFEITQKMVFSGKNIFDNFPLQPPVIYRGSTPMGLDQIALRKVGVVACHRPISVAMR